MASRHSPPPQPHLRRRRRRHRAHTALLLLLLLLLLWRRRQRQLLRVRGHGAPPLCARWARWQLIVSAVRRHTLQSLLCLPQPLRLQPLTPPLPGPRAWAHLLMMGARTQSCPPQWGTLRRP
jgi:hypothetical protein